jgi:hypothetical protein
VVAGGGTPGYTYTIQQGSLPHGLVLDSTTGFITGKPTTLGTYSVTVEVTDSTTPTPETASQTLSMEVLPSP